MNLYSQKFIERLQNDDALNVLDAFQRQLAECTVLAGAAKGLACSDIVCRCQAGETLRILLFGTLPLPARHTSTTSRQTLNCTVTTA